jgi:hypothetical protein
VARQITAERDTAVEIAEDKPRVSQASKFWWQRHAPTCWKSISPPYRSAVVVGPSTAFGNLRRDPTFYLLTPWNKVLLEKLTVLQLVKNFLAYYET